MSIHGLLIGLIAFVLIGLFHPIVIHGEYHFGVKIWPAFLVLGAVLCFLSLLLEHILPSAACGIAGFCCLWSIRELFQQRDRAAKGWFPKKDRATRRSL
ncbi:MAG: DUF4491 family protein [Treponema sp.]|jgi:hypothetical protein|nr:DUF4491 family protein [Treponema sp.]